MSARKITAAAGATTEVLPVNPADTVVTVGAENHLTFIVASERVVSNAETKVAGLIATNGQHNVRQERTFETLAAETLRLRRMHSARPIVQAILGEDMPDLIGLSDAYKTSQGRVNDAARDLLVNALRKDGLTVKAATIHADQEIERIRQSVSRYVRIAVEAEAKAIGGDAGAVYLLGHGFNYSTVVSTKNNPGVIAAKGWKLVKGDDGAYSLHKPEVKALDAAPEDASDQVNPTETADAEIKAAADETLTNPSARINFAVGELRTASADKRLAGMNVADRLALARLVGQAAFETLLAIGETLPEAESREVALMARQVSGVIVAKLLPAVAEAASK